jgi:hypothetical protein
MAAAKKGETHEFFHLSATRVRMRLFMDAERLVVVQ